MRVHACICKHRATYLQARALHEPLAPDRVTASHVSDEVKATPHDSCKALLLHHQLQQHKEITALGTTAVGEGDDTLEGRLLQGLLWIPGAQAMTV